MKNLRRQRRQASGSLAGFLDPSQIHSTKTGRASEKSCHKLLLINGRILDPPPKSSGNVRFCFPDLTEVIRTFALKPVLQACQKCKTRTVTAALTGGCNTPKSLHRVAPCCSVLHRVARKKFSDLRCNTSIFPQSRAGAWWYCRDAPWPPGNKFCTGAGRANLLHWDQQFHFGKTAMKTRVLRVGLGGISLVLLAVAAWAYMDQLANGAVTRAWLRQYNSVVSNSLDVVTAILRDPSGNIIVAGNTDDGFAGGNMVLLKYSGVDGSLLWHRRLSGPTNSYGAIAGAAVDAHGNIAITGYSYNGQDRDYYTAKFSTEGTLLWARSYDGPSDDVAMAVSFDRNGNVVVTGGSSQDEWRNDDDDLTRLDYYTAKYAAADGALLWERRYNGPGDNRDQARAIAIDANNNVVVTGYSDGESNRDQYTAKYAASDGALLWEGRRAGFGSGNALAFDASGNVIVAGTSQDDAHAVKYLGVDGTLLWEQRRDGPTGYRDALGAVAVDQSGNVIVTGYLSGNDFYLDAYTAKYAASDGAVLWEQLYNSPANNSDAGQSVAVDRVGNVIVQGYSFDSPGWYWNQFTAKYAAADGAVLWQRLQDGPRNTQGLMAALVLDGADNVVVLGSFGAGYDPDISTAKLAGTDGSMLWEQRYNGPAHRAGMGEAVAIDAHGNVFVTGHSEGDDTAMDYLTVKYAPNGTMLWERRHNGPRNGSDAPRGGLVLDPEGNAIVSGGSSGDFYTVKYAASDGAVLWE